jgi:hypothetical protein
MYLQEVISKKLRKQQFFIGALKFTDENSGIRIRTKMSRAAILEEKKRDNFTCLEVRHV